MSKESEIIHRMFVLVHGMKKDFQDFIKPHGLTEMEAKIIFHMNANTIKTSELINHFKKHKSTIRQKTRSLEHKGFINITSSQDDGRERIIQLTIKGQKFCTQLKNIESTFYKNIFKKITQEEKKYILDILSKIEIRHYENIC